MFQRKSAAPKSIDDMLKDIEGLNGNAEVKTVLQKFINEHLIEANGVIIIYTKGTHVDIESTKFSEPEATWLFVKALKKVEQLFGD